MEEFLSPFFREGVRIFVSIAFREFLKPSNPDIQ
jgi:hypothetical protein